MYRYQIAFLTLLCSLLAIVPHVTVSVLLSINSDIQMMCKIVYSNILQSFVLIRKE